VGDAKLLPLKKGGEFARGLERGRKAALGIFEKLRLDGRFATAFAPELDIVVFAPKAATSNEASVLSRKIFEAAARNDLHLAVCGVADSVVGRKLGSDGSATARRHLPALVLLKPEHFDWVDRIWGVLSSSADEILRRSQLYAH